MVSIVDALMISVGMDASAYLKGSKDVNAALDKTKDAAKKAGKDVEAVAKTMASGLSDVATAGLEIAAVFAGGKGFKDLVEGAVKANTSLGLLNSNIGQSPQLLTAWGIAAARMGGSAAAAQASIKSMSDMLTDFRTMGKKLPDELFMLSAKSQAAGGPAVDFQHGVERLMVTAAAAAKQLAQTDPQAAARFLSAIAADPATAARMIQMGANIEAYAKQQAKLSPSDKDIKAAQGMTDAQAKLSASYDYLGTKIMTALAPALTFLIDKFADLVKWVADFAEAHPRLVKGLTIIFAVLTGGAAVAAIASIAAITAGLVGLAGISFTGLIAGLGAIGLTGAAGLGLAGALGAFDEAKAGEAEDGGKSALRKKMLQTNGNEALRRRGHGADLPSGKAGKLTDNQREAYRSAREDGPKRQSRSSPCGRHVRREPLQSTRCSLGQQALRSWRRTVGRCSIRSDQSAFRKDAARLVRSGSNQSGHLGNPHPSRVCQDEARARRR